MNERIKELMNQTGIPTTIPFDQWCEKFAELIVKDIVDDLGTLRWSGYDKGWDLAIETVRKDLIKRIEE